MVPDKMRDVIVVLPGIMGSVLQKDGRDVWGFSGEAMLQYILTAGESLRQLRLSSDDDGSLDHLDDGVTSSRLMPDAHIVPGLWKIDGYGQLCRVLKEAFDLKPDENYFEFSYDWRRDNRVAARKLQKLITRALPEWQKRSGCASARVILIAHSMGGLISRYFLEALEGWKVCSALITFGTPYRGSVKALNYLVHGYRAGLADLTELFLSCTSVYQLLPTYKSLQLETGESIYVEEFPGLTDLQRHRALEAKAFHDEINIAVKAHSASEKYRKTMRILPVIGIEQPTLQSARINNNVLLSTNSVPVGVDASLSGGDGTVPLPSAIPLELSLDFRFPFFAELHSSLQNNPFVLKQLIQWLRQSQTTGLENLKGPSDGQSVAPLEKPAISLSLEDEYPSESSILVKAAVRCEQARVLAVTASLYPLSLEQEPQSVHFSQVDDGWVAALADLQPGAYRIRVTGQCDQIDIRPSPVSDVFLVTPAECSATSPN